MDLELLQNPGIVLPAFYQYYSFMKNKRTIIINEGIGDETIENAILPLMTFDEDDSQEMVRLFINTPGGSLFEGMNLCDIIDRFSKPLEVRILGHAHSMGAVIACAGSKNPNVIKTCYPFSCCLFHAGHLALDDDLIAARDNMEFIQKYNKMINVYIAENTKITMAELEFPRQWHMTASEMLEKGIIDKIL